jgi:hypothetical protein
LLRGGRRGILGLVHLPTRSGDETKMPVSRSQAREICTKPEMELVEASFPPSVNALSPARLRQKVSRARRLQDKFRDLAQKQNRASKGDTPTGRGPRANARTERKARLFDETRARFEKRLEQAEAS